MKYSGLLKVAAFVFVVGLVALLYWLTLYEPEDPCEDLQQDVGGAILADDPGDQEALVNRAIILRGKCKQDPEEDAPQ